MVNAFDFAKFVKRSILLVQVFSVLIFSQQTEAQSMTTANSFVSAADQDLTVRSVTALPFTDNINGIYSKPLQRKFTELVSNDKQWSYLPQPDSAPPPPLDLEETPEAVKTFLAIAKADGLFTFRLTKGPKGLNGRLTFFTGKSGLPLLQEELQNYPGFEIADLEKQLQTMYGKLKARLPYRGLILSRRGQDVTINLGQRDGLRDGDEISVVQILKLNRHPKLKFMIGTDKEILGKIKVFKSDDSLSFASVIFEREAGTIQPNAKLLPTDFVRYNNPVRDGGHMVPGLNNRDDRDLSYGENPRAWRPQDPPQYGRIAVMAGLGAYSQSSNLTTGSLEASTSMAPEIAIKGEIWINSEWNILYGLRQSVFAVTNPDPNSTPSTLNMALSSYSVLGAYNFLMSEDFFGPKIQVSGGYGTYSSHTDQSTPVLAFTNMDYGGLQLGLAGQFPLTTEIPVDLGAQLNLFLSPKMSESNPSGTAGKSTILQFGFFGIYHLQSRFKIRGELNFEYYATDFSGATARSTNSTQKRTSLLGGLEYVF
jgi:hypothetical protein